MKNTIRKIKNMKYTKLVIGIIIGVIIAGTSVYYAATIYYDSINVGYDNTVSGLDADNVQDALDELCDVADLNDRVSNLETTVSNNTFTKYIYISGGSNGLSDPVTLNAIKTKYATLSQGTYIGTLSCSAFYGLLIMKVNDEYGTIYAFSYRNSASGSVKVLNLFGGTWKDWGEIH